MKTINVIASVEIQFNTDEDSATDEHRQKAIDTVRKMSPIALKRMIIESLSDADAYPDMFTEINEWS